MAKKYKGKKSSQVNVDITPSSGVTPRNKYLNYSDDSDYYQKPPSKPPPPSPPSTPIPWYWSGSVWEKPTGCVEDGELHIHYNCDNPDGVACIAPATCGLPGGWDFVPTPRWNNYTEAQFEAFVANGEQLDYRYYWTAAMHQTNWAGISSTGQQIYAEGQYKAPYDPSLETGMGSNGHWCCSYPKHLFPGGPFGGTPYQGSIVIDFHLENAFGFPVPMQQGSNPCVPVITGGTTTSFNCTHLGNNHFRYTHNIHSSLGLAMGDGIMGDAPQKIVYKDLQGGTYTFFWDDFQFDDGTGIGPITQTITPSSAPFVVEDPNNPCICNDPLLPINQMPYTYREDWPHWNTLSYNPPLTYNIDQYNWLVNIWGQVPNFSGGTTIPQGHHVENLTSNHEYPNQSTFCEYCRDWQNAGSVPNTWGGSPPTPQSINHPWTVYILGTGNIPSGQTYTWMDANQNPYPVNNAGIPTYSTSEPFLEISDAETGCECCPLDSNGNYTSVGLDPGYYSWPIPPTGTWMGPTI